MRLAPLAFLLLTPGAVRAASTLVVLSEPPSPSYREALAGLRAELGEGIETASADRPLPPGPHGVIIALGGRAAQRARLDGAPLVVALAPSYRRPDAPAATVRVALTPSPERFVGALSAAGVKRLLAVRSSSSEPEFLRRVAKAGAQAGVVIDDGSLSSADELPHLLRTAGSRADAIWLAPDPAVVTPEAFETAREFARARGIPFFAPAAGLVKDEIRGELTVTFLECGREAGRAARELLAGRAVAKIVYPAPGSPGTNVAPSTVPAAVR